MTVIGFRLRQARLSWDTAQGTNDPFIFVLLIILQIPQKKNPQIHILEK